jgi:hypothetical protein
MASFQNLIFGPLSSESCIYFFFITAFFYFLLIVTLIAGILLIIRNPKEINFKVAIHGLLLFFNIFLAYFVNRLLYTMCTKSLA